MNALLNLLRSMRFAIAILTVVAVAATSGSVLEQNQPAVTYVSRYGEFWAVFFDRCGLTDVYHAPWFFLLLAFMACSTTLCLWQNTPAMLRDLRSFREQKSLASLRQLPHSVELDLPAGGMPAAPLAAYLRAQGFRFKQAASTNGYLLASRSGGARRLGYLLVHGAMVLICAGGLVDGNVGLRLRLWSGALRLESRDLEPAQVPAASRLPADAGSFRASMNVTEGDSSNTALLQLGDGYLQQQLPFAVHLKRFRIEHYANGQPKDFASDIDIVDGARHLPVTLQVNHPYTYRGVTLFQSGFADGGSKVRLNMLPLDGAAGQPVSGTVGRGSPLLLNGEPYTLEFSELRAINVFSNDRAPERRWSSQGLPGERVHDVGPSLSFRLRDKLGQSDEWHVYQRPAMIDGASYFLLGHRGQQDAALRYLRLPADANASLGSYRQLLQAMADPARRASAAKAVAAGVQDRHLAAALETAAQRLLQGFSVQGYRALAGLVPADGDRNQQMRVGRLYLGLLERAAQQLIRPADPRLVHDILQAHNEALELQLPALFQFERYEQVNASGLQVTHAPGAMMVYLGSALLALGVMAMYFVQERRLWLHADPHQLLLAFSANRHSPALQNEFERHRDAIGRLILAAAAPSTATAK
ncbi:MAG: cytochrome c biogenesis protein ResB [Pseudomonadota bacterium]